VDVLARATTYVSRFVHEFKNVVAEERYVQQIVTFNGRKVDSKADFLLVQLGPEREYIPFRDVFEVNGGKVRDGESRLIELLSHPSADLVTQARAINAVSSRYNIGVQRTINNPLIGIVLLQEVVRPSFTFSLGDSEKIDGEMTDVLRFEESGRPTIIRESNGDAPAHGRYWIARTDGAVLRSELLIDTAKQKTRVTSSFHRDERFGVAVPVQMEESYTPGNTAPTAATAKYGRFRQFEVKTEEAVKELPGPK
jgi:hypothetical protein